MYTVDLNSDVGESFGQYVLGSDSEVLKYVTSANIACGWHAGDSLTMARTVNEAIKNKVNCGAHPGFPDLMGFGRRELKVTENELTSYVMYQMGALDAFMRQTGNRITHVKPHGAMYNMASVDAGLARAIAQAVYAFDREIIVLGLAGSAIIDQARRAGLRTASEVFADRAYRSDGTLVPRSQEGAVIHDPVHAIMRAVKMVKEGIVESIDGTFIPIKADSICVHGDHPEAVTFLKAIHSTFQEENIRIVSLDERV